MSGILLSFTNNAIVQKRIKKHFYHKTVCLLVEKVADGYVDFVDVYPCSKAAGLTRKDFELYQK